MKIKKRNGTQRAQSLEQTLLPSLLLFKNTQRWKGETVTGGPLQQVSIGVDTHSHAPGVTACWPMRGSPPSTSTWKGVISCSAVISMVFSSTSSHVGLEKADSGRVILCISRSYTRCSCCFFMSRPLHIQDYVVIYQEDNYYFLRAKDQSCYANRQNDSLCFYRDTNSVCIFGSHPSFYFMIRSFRLHIVCR